jgi:hypothetical protein
MKDGWLNRWRHMLAGRALGRGVVAAAILTIFFLRDCRPRMGSPEGVARQFIVAARAGDRRAAWGLLGPRTRSRLDAEAAAATNRAGGSLRFTPLDVFEASAPESSYSPENVILRERSGAHAVVDVLGPAGRRDTLELVKVDGAWRVELSFQ